MGRARKKMGISMGLLAAFVLWTIIVCNVDVQAVGPQGTSVGLAKINWFIHQFTGVHMFLYTLTDWLGMVPVGVCLCFGMLGLLQWIKRKNLVKVDHSILALGVFYVIVMAVYVFFETYVINNRPVLIDGRLEASYPSSTTVLVLCVMPTALMQANHRIQNRFLRKSIALVIWIFTVFMVAGRVVSGVHWFSDIIGGVLISSALVGMYDSFCSCQVKKALIDR